MTTKLKIAIAVGVLLVAGVAYARTRKATLRCSAGASFKAVSKNDPIYTQGSVALRAQIDKYGGYCARQGTVTYAGASSLITDPSQLSDAGADNGDNNPDAADGLITSPAQLG